MRAYDFSLTTGATMMSRGSVIRNRSPRRSRRCRPRQPRPRWGGAGVGPGPPAPPPPLWRPDGALAGPSGALLAPGLGAAAPHLGPRLGRLGAGTTGGELGSHHLVHDRDVGLHAEQGVVDVDRSRRAAGGLGELEGRHRYFPLPLLSALAASRTRTTEPLGPGTDPFTSNRSRSASASTTVRLSVVVFCAPDRPAMRVPGKTRDGVAQAPMAPGARWTRWVPWLAPRPPKPWRFITPEKPLPLLTDVTSTSSPCDSRSAPISWPTS